MELVDQLGERAAVELLRNRLNVTLHRFERKLADHLLEAPHGDDRVELLRLGECIRAWSEVR